MNHVRIAAAIGAAALALALVQPAAAQVGDSKADPRSRAQGTTDNPSTSSNPVGTPNSTNANRCAGMQGKERDDCMKNLKGAKGKGGDKSASSTRSDTAMKDTAPRASTKGGGSPKGVTDNPSTSQNPNTGGSQVNRGGDSNMKK